MKYRSGYKYQLATGEVIQTALRPETDLITEYLLVRTRMNRQGPL